MFDIMYVSNTGGVFMVDQQQKLVLSPYMEIYELVVSKDNLLWQIKELVDFGFIYDLSDVDVVERSRYDMSFKYFLDMAPEETVIDPGSLTKFRKM